MKHAEGHDPNCPSKARRLYIRHYDPVRRKQIFITWGATCTSCGMLFHIKRALVKGSEHNDYMLNRSQRRREDRIKRMWDKRIDNIQDPEKRIQVRKRLNRVTKTEIW